MKTLIVYTSQTGFTRKYAGWLADRMKGDVLELKEAQKKPESFFDGYDAIVYGGWAMAGKVVKVNWFYDKAKNWKDKRLAVFCVGGSPNGAPETKVFLEGAVPAELSAYIKPFYCQGGFNYERMNGASKLAMKMFIAVQKKKAVTDEQKKMAEMISSSYDVSDAKYVEPIAEYLEA